MAELQERYPPLDDIETLIRVAQDYVCASDDLRPRVLELVRGEQRERQVRRWFSLLALVVLAVIPVLISLLCAAVGDSLEAGRSTLPSQRFSSADASMRSSDPSWQMVETFTQLRKIQAELLQL